ncbi:MAG: hypothetical protein GX119_06855 [Syntrophomonadaceae bacterium]|jgi:hypothetical protein|nr:hypothetical protein [Syntrophomonadaceae bacterium]
MAKLFTTGPVENAVSNPALSVMVKILNNSPTNSLTATATLYNLDGSKSQVSSEILTISPLSADFKSFEVDLLKEFEIQIQVDREEAALVSVWGLDADARLIAAQRFTPSELKEYYMPFAKIKKLSFSKPKKRKRGR